jgi:hypothetical protein
MAQVMYGHALLLFLLWLCHPNPSTLPATKLPCPEQRVVLVCLMMHLDKLVYIGFHVTYSTDTA